MGLPAPAIVIVDSPLPNAMAVGRHPDTAVLVVTSGLDAVLSLVELEGVLAHELVHIKRHDTVVSAPSVVIGAFVSFVVGPARATHVVHRLVGPGREFAADQRAAAVVRYPPGLGGALETMADISDGPSWPPGRGRISLLTRWLWIDPRPTGCRETEGGRTTSGTSTPPASARPPSPCADPERHCRPSPGVRRRRSGRRAAALVGDLAAQLGARHSPGGAGATRPAGPPLPVRRGRRGWRRCGPGARESAGP